jgi:hypothetical protein
VKIFSEELPQSFVILSAAKDLPGLPVSWPVTKRLVSAERFLAPGRSFADAQDDKTFLAFLCKK